MENYALSKKHRFVGIFDTGAGGLNVLSACRKLLPNENYLYFADNAESPYGNYDEEKIRKLTFAAVNKMTQYGIKALLLACNTATSAAADALRKAFYFPVIGMEPAVKPAAAAACGKDILLLCTPATAKQDKLSNLLKSHERKKIIVAPQKNLAKDIESNLGNADALQGIAKNALSPYKDFSFGAAVLGCTHYIFIKDMIADILGGVPVFDGVDGTVLQLKKKLEESDLLSLYKEKGQLLIVNTAPPKISYWDILKGI